MNIWFYRSDAGNFGDDLNQWLWDYLLPGWREWDDEITLLGVGTLLTRNQFGYLKGKKLLVLGSGAGHKPLPRNVFLENCDIRAVRGPHTAKRLGLPLNKAVTDPAVMLSQFADFQGFSKKTKPVFLPHHKTASERGWKTICEQAGLEFLSPSKNAKDVVQSISSANLVITESLHGAIVADTFRVPWIPLQIRGDFDWQKWRDWSASMDININIPRLFPFSTQIARFLPQSSLKLGLEVFGNFQTRSLTERLKAVVSSTSPFLSESSVLQERKRRYEKLLHNVRSDYA